MSDWDGDGEQLHANIRHVLSDALRDARQRLAPTVEHARSWQITLMQGLTTPGPQFVGRFRGEPGLEACEVEIGGYSGVPSNDVAEALKAFEAKLQETVSALDGLIAPNQELSADDLAAVIDLCAWVHSRWIRIHPFANGNGRTARLWANSVAMRYGVPPFVRLRPRPNDGYGVASWQAMTGQWRTTIPVFRRMYREAVRR